MFCLVVKDRVEIVAAARDVLHYSSSEPAITALDVEPPVKVFPYQLVVRCFIITWFCVGVVCAMCRVRRAGVAIRGL